MAFWNKKLFKLRGTPGDEGSTAGSDFDDLVLKSGDVMSGNLYISSGNLSNAGVPSTEPFHVGGATTTFRYGKGKVSSLVNKYIEASHEESSSHRSSIQVNQDSSITMRAIGTIGTVGMRSDISTQGANIGSGSTWKPWTVLAPTSPDEYLQLQQVTAFKTAIKECADASTTFEEFQTAMLAHPELDGLI